MAADRYREFSHAILPLAGAGLQRNIALARYTSFRVGGPADLLLEPPSVEVLASALIKARELEIPVTRLGGGTNVLVSDCGVRGLVIRLGKTFDYQCWKEGDGEAGVEAGAATPLSRLVRDSVDRGYAGLEFAAGIPGTVGGGALMNAGAFGCDLGQAVVGAAGVTLGGDYVDLDRARLEFSYRRLALDVDVVVTFVRFKLLRSSVGRLRRVVQTVQDKRRRRQPRGFPNAGSVFKNPQGEYAGRLIEQAGLKGRRVGGAEVSAEHANFIVSVGSATAQDVHTLMGLMREAVWKRSGVWLEPELRLIGEWE